MKSNRFPVLLSILCTVFVSQSVAQARLFISPHIGIGNTSVKNKEEKDVANRQYMILKSQLKSQYGFDIGMRFKESMGLQSIHTGLSMWHIGQEYSFNKSTFSGEYDIMLDRWEEFYEKMNLRYLQVPLIATFNLASNPRFRPILSIGVYGAYLLSLDDSLYTRHRNQMNSFNYRTTNNKNYTIYNTHTFYISEDVKFDKMWINRLNYGAICRAGMEFVLTDKWSFKAEAMYQYGINNTDYDKEIQYITEPNSFLSQQGPFKYFDKSYGRFYQPRSNTRPPSHNHWVGGILSLSYTPKGGLLSNQHN